jgi:polyribonucleotide nucleotidyltransferase
MGLVLDEKSGKYKVLTDIQGIEDHGGDMDFKVAGTKNGISAIQLDVKIFGLTLDICKETFAKAKKARLNILEKMNAVIPESKKEMSPYAPRIYTIRIEPDKIREVIGRGGETINKIIDESGGKDVTKIDIEEDGLVLITSHNAELAEKALTWIKNLTREVQIGEIYEGVVTQIMKDRNTGREIGALVEVIPGQEGMVHISQFSDQRINNVSDVVKVDEKIKVKVMGIDKERGRIELSVKALNPNRPATSEDFQPRQQRPRREFRKRF